MKDLVITKENIGDGTSGIVMVAQSKKMIRGYSTFAVKILKGWFHLLGFWPTIYKNRHHNIALKLTFKRKVHSDVM